MSTAPPNPPAPMLRLDGVSVRYGTRSALEDIRLEVFEHETLCLLGPSGSGKSTLLRAVAGLQPVTAGRTLLAGRVLDGMPPHRRGVGLMFQDHQLFPHRDVGQNVGFGLRVRGEPRARQRQSVARLLELVGLPGAESRPVTALSGGEQQRVALARALAPEPGLLMLDEPLGQLDRGLRERLVVELRALFHTLGTTVLAVTHDQHEAFALADRVAIMNEGTIAQIGTPQEVWQRPATEFVARFLGFDNVVPATVRGRVADTPWGRLPVPPGTPDGTCRLLVRPTGVRFTPDGDGLPCVVRSRTFRGHHVLLRLAPDSGPHLQAEVPLREAPAEGQAVRVGFAAEEVAHLPG
ncbi:ABC transporter ATP-binding protein [Streptomyces sp. NPDC059740]|uniref:ABC transporter ATP-binding protein n=1 Tax=Streptomyces sp. NPDC059740 TaxID=3346926 RepID=UPI00366A2CF8